MRRIRHLAVGAAVVVAAIGIGDGASIGADHRVRAFRTTLTGASEVPGPGDADGFGVAALIVNVNRERVCYVLAVGNIAPATMAHIHVGAVTASGPVVVNFKPPTSGVSVGCTSVAPALAEAIVTTPANYYVNVHNAEFPAGAVRGQLS